MLAMISAIITLIAGLLSLIQSIITSNDVLFNRALLFIIMCMLTLIMSRESIKDDR
jgi:hypothetical protein